MSAPHRIACLLAALLLAGLLPAAPRAGEPDPVDGADSTDVDFPDLAFATDADADSAAAAAAADTSATGDQAFQFPTTSTGVRPTFRNQTRALDTRVDVSNEASVSIAFPNTWTLGAKVTYDRQIPRELKREAWEKSLQITTSKLLMGKVPLSLAANRREDIREQNRGEATYRRDESETSNLSMTSRGGYRFNDWLSGNMSANVGATSTASRSNKGVNRDATNTNRRLAAHLDLDPGGNLKITTGYAGTADRGTGQLLTVTDDVMSTSDSLQVRASWNWNRKLDLTVQGGRLEQVSERLDFKRDNFNMVLFDSIPFKEETRERKVGGNLDLGFTPWESVDLSASFSYQEDEKRVPSALNKDRDSQEQRVDLSARLKPWRGQSLSLSYKEGVTESDDVTAPGRRQIKQELSCQTSQELGGTLEFRGDAYFLLNQDFYADKARNPQDRDQAQTRLSATVEGRPASWIKAINTIQWYETRDLLIQPRRSAGSKDRNTLSWRTKLSYEFLKRYTVNQSYEISVTEEDFFFTKDKNALNREYVLITSSSVPLRGRVALDFKHEFRLREQGAYLPDPMEPGSPKTFFKESRQKKEILTLGLSYSFREYLRISCEDELGREVNYDYADGSEDLSSFGTLRFTVRFNRNLGKTGRLAFDLVHQARFGRFVRENQRSLWLPTLSIEYTF
ncbi:MAG: hypothetical protein JW819_00885 [Candidatus Krumholzibacteriota bacterium]|nr:hypothetical protein [Candidatus Krumholzibacteriota bacterium]